MSREIRRVPANWCHPQEFNQLRRRLEFTPITEAEMPKGDWYQLFETVTDGCPLSPAFSSNAELVVWLVNNADYWGHHWTRAQAEGIVSTGFAYSGMIAGDQLYTAEETAEYLGSHR